MQCHNLVCNCSLLSTLGVSALQQGCLPKQHSLWPAMPGQLGIQDLPPGLLELCWAPLELHER